MSRTPNIPNWLLATELGSTPTIWTKITKAPSQPMLRLRSLSLALEALTGSAITPAASTNYAGM